MAKDHFKDYDTTAGNNTDVDGVSIAEGTAPSNINDAIRELMSHVAEFYADTAGSIDSGGAGGAYTLATNDAVAAYAQAQMYAFEANHAFPDTATATLNINAIGAKAIRKHVTLNLENGDIATNQICVVAYEATNDCFHLLNPTAEAPIVQGIHTAWVPAAAMRPAVTSGCGSLSSTETTAGQPDIVALAFDKDSDEYAQFSIGMPKSWDEGTVTFIPFWTFSTGSAAETVEWDLQAVAVGDDDSIDAAYGTPQNSQDTAIAAEDLHVGAESSAITIAGTPTAGDLTFFQIFRDVSEDNLAGDALLKGIQVMATINAKDDA